MSSIRYGTTKEQYAKVAEKNHRHSVNNPYAQFQDEYTLEEILNSKPIFEPLTVSNLLYPRCRVKSLSLSLLVWLLVYPRCQGTSCDTIICLLPKAGNEDRMYSYITWQMLCYLSLEIAVQSNFRWGRCCSVGQ